MPFPPSQEGLGAVKAGAPARPEPQAAAEPQRPAWHPPLPVWLFLLLHLLSFGIYTLFWIGRLAGDLRRHAEPKVRGWRYVLGYLVLIPQPFIAARLGRHLAALNAQAGRSVGPPIWVIVVLAAVGVVLSLVSWVSDFEVEPLRALALLGLLLGLSGLPWLLLQHQFNVYKAQLAGVAWRTPPNRVTAAQYLVLSFGLLFWGLCVLVFTFERYGFDPAPAGIALAPAAEIRGDSGLYALSVPEAGWRRVPKGGITEDADLELVGPGRSTRLVVYVNPHKDQSVDDFVDYRRKALRDAADTLEVEEVRRLLDASMVPVSFARYRSQSALFGEDEVYWVATLRSEKKMIEVIGWADPNGPGPAALEGLVKSVVLREEALQSSSPANSASTSR